MPDEAHEAAEVVLLDVEQRITEEYRRAYEEMIRDLADFWEWYATGRDTMLSRVGTGEIEQDEYVQWLRETVLLSDYWRDQVTTMADALTRAGEMSVDTINDELPGIYADAANYGTYTVESGAGVSTPWTLYDEERVSDLREGRPDLYPTAAIDRGRDRRWNAQNVTSAITQGVLLGETVVAIARRILRTADMALSTALRTARTTVTGVEGAGRLASYETAQDLGVDVRKQWVAVNDDRTRDSHRRLDGEVADLDEEFSNGLRYPGDPNGPISERANCRCTLRRVLPEGEGWGGMTYDEWKAAKGG